MSDITKKRQFPGGLFVTLEGGEACGKSTQSVRLATWFESLGYDVVSVGEPGGTSYGLDARELFLKHHRNLTPRAEIGLLVTAKAQLLETVILPALLEGKVVICDRYTDTLFAYQHYAKGYPSSMIEELLIAMRCEIDPDFTLLYYCDPAQARDRGLVRKNAGGQYNDLDAETLSFYTRVSSGYAARLEFRPKASYAVISSEINTMDQVTKLSTTALLACMEKLAKERDETHDIPMKRQALELELEPR